MNQANTHAVTKPKRFFDVRHPARYAGFVVAMIVLVLGLWQNLDAIDTSQFHPDESRWLNRASYLDAFLDPTSSRWEDRYLTRGQPPMGSYVTGLGLLLQGRDLTTNGPWDFHFGNESTTTWNAIKGNLPDPADIQAARRTNAVIGALSCLVICLIVTQLTHWLGGLVAGVFLAFHPLQIYLASIGVSDAVFTLFFALAAFAALRLAMAPSWWRTLALALILAFGASTKLTPLFVALPAAVLGGAILVDPWLRRIRLVGRVWSWISRVDIAPQRQLGWMLVSLPAMTAALFVISYPYLWSDPIGRTLNLIDFRRAEMENQARIWPASSIDSRSEAARRTWQNLEDFYSSSGRGLSALGESLGRSWDGRGIDLPIALIGLAILIVLAWWRGINSPTMLTLAIVSVQSAIILSGLRVDFNRYYLPLVFSSGVGIGILTGWTCNTVSTGVSRWRVALPQRNETHKGRARTVSSATRSPIVDR